MAEFALWLLPVVALLLAGRYVFRRISARRGRSSTGFSVRILRHMYARGEIDAGLYQRELARLERGEH